MWIQRRWKRAIAETVWAWVPPGTGGKLLDIGGGTSPVVSPYYLATSVDVDANKVKWNEQNGYSWVNYMKGDAVSLGFTSATFDRVLCIEVIEHVIQPQLVLEEIARVLKPGGLAVIATPDYSRRRWRMVEWVYRKLWPGAYCDDHVTQLGSEELVSRAGEYGLHLLNARHVFGCDYVGLFIRD